MQTAVAFRERQAEFEVFNSHVLDFWEAFFAQHGIVPTKPIRHYSNRIRTNAHHINRPVHSGSALRRPYIRRLRQKGSVANETAVYHLFIIDGCVQIGR